MSKAKIGATQVPGMARKGLSEIAQYLPAFNHAGTQSVEDIAIWPNQTQGEIAQARGGPGKGPEQEAADGTLTLAGLIAYAEQKAKEAYQGMEHGHARGQGEIER